MKDAAGEDGNGRFGSAIGCAKCREYDCECDSHRCEKRLQIVSCCNFRRSEKLTEYMGLCLLAICKKDLFRTRDTYHRSIEAKTS
jgi:hypothetical protein